MITGMFLITLLTGMLIGGWLNCFIGVARQIWR